MATLPVLAPALALVALLGAIDNLFMQRQTGSDLWNYRVGCSHWWYSYSAPHCWAPFLS